MPNRGMISLFHHRHHSPEHPTSDHHHHHHHRSMQSSMMEDNIAKAEPIITKWDPNGSDYSKITSIFYESREEARHFILAVADLKRSMQFFVADHHHSAADTEALSRAQRLMDIAMKRLQKEFYQILAANRTRLDSESLSRASNSTSISSVSTSNSLSEMEEEDPDGGDEDGNSTAVVEKLPTEAMADLRAIAECMVSSGYVKECVKVFKVIRRSIVEEGLYRLGFERLTASQINKLDWDSVEHRMRSWNSACRVAVRTLFSGERFLSDYIFGFSDSLKESCFAEIIGEPAERFFTFPSLVASKPKRSSEKVFQFLNLYDSISDCWSEIESIFSYNSTSSVIVQVLASIDGLKDPIRSMLNDFESAIQKDSSKSIVPGGGIHPLTRYVMNYLVFLGDYGNAMADIYDDHPLPADSPLPDTFFHFINTTSCLASPLSHHSSLEEEDYTTMISPQVSSRFAWILLVLLCKLDGKAELYKNAAFSYLFLCNNLNYVVQKVRGSKLRHVLGYEWTIENEEKAKTYANNYIRATWKKVVDTIPEEPSRVVAVEGMESAKERMREFNLAFEEAYRTQSGWVIADGKMREKVKLSIARVIMGPYREFYDVCRPVMKTEVRFSPEDLGNYLSDLFYKINVSGTNESVRSTVSGSSTGRSHK